jgi:hypothetical protein
MALSIGRACFGRTWKLLEEKTWGERRGSNPRHLGPQPSALPAELRPPCAVRG